MARKPPAHITNSKRFDASLKEGFKKLSPPEKIKKINSFIKTGLAIDVPEY